MRRKKKSRWKRVVLWGSLSLAVVVITSLFVMDYAVDKVLRSMSGMDTILEELEASESTDTLREKENTHDGSDNSTANKSADLGGTVDNNGTVEQPDQTNHTSQTNQPDHIDRVNENTDASAQTGAESTYKAEVSTDKAREIEEKASVSEKATVAALLMKNLNASDIKLLSDLASGGLNLEEKKKARTLILEKLTEAEYNKLIGIAQKFGVSQGKQYSEVIKEE